MGVSTRSVNIAVWADLIVNFEARDNFEPVYVAIFMAHAMRSSRKKEAVSLQASPKFWPCVGDYPSLSIPPDVPSHF